MENKKEKKKIHFKYNLKTYFGFLKKYQKIFLGITILVFIKEAIIVVDKYIYKVIIDNGYELIAQSISKSFFTKILVTSLFVYIAVAIIRASCHWFIVHFMNRLECKIMFDLKNKFLGHIVHLSHNFHTTHKTGSLISRLIRASGASERVTDIIIFNILPLIFQILIVSTSLFFFDITSALVILVTVAIFISYSVVVLSFQREANVEENRREDIEKGNISDIFTNIDSIKYYGKENAVKRRYAEISALTKNAMIKSVDYYRWLDAGHTLIVWGATGVLMYFALTKFLAGTMTIGTVVFVYAIFGNVMNPLYNFVHGIRQFYRSMADFEDLFEYGKIENEIKDKKDAKNLKVKSGKVEINNLSFKYHETALFKNFNLTVEKNNKVALVGHSGCGKTTLLKLLYRLYDLDSGEVLIDGVNITDVKQESLRSEMSIVPQECILFDDTIYNNIVFSKPDATKKEVLEAIKFAQLDKVIANFPNKEKTIVGERGVKLSGGEKQRVSIARAILADKKILILDEATSALDSQTEHEIQTDLEKLMKGRTSIIIAHRLSTIMKADKIIVMKEGDIVQSGTHQDLIEQKGEYKHLWNLQKGGYILD